MEVNNEKLIELINKMKEEKTAQSQNEVISQVLRSKFLCPVILEQTPVDGKVQITRDTKIQFSIIKTQDGKTFLIAFTGDEEVQKWQQQKVQQSIIYTFEDYAMVVTHNDNLDGFIIDPKGANLVFTQEMIEEIKSNLTRENVVAKDTEIQLKAVDEIAEDFKMKLTDTLRNYADITGAMLLNMKQGEEISYLLIVDSAEEDKTIYNNIAGALIPFLNGLPLNITHASTEIGKAVQDKFEPIYTKA